jgi:starch-binding outer membrane protein, SusD/RagB family
VRLQLLPQVVAARDKKENEIPGGTNLTLKYLAPIPFSEMTLNPSWTQNEGY